MKKVKGLALILGLMLVMTTGVSVFAAGEASLQMSEKTASVLVDGASVADIQISNTDVRLQTVGNKLNLRFNARKGAQSASLKEANKLTIEGDVRSLTISSDVPETAEVIIKDGANISALTTYSSAKITVNGVVGDLAARGAAPVTVGDKGVINTARMINPKSMLKGNGAVALAQVNSQAQAPGKGVQTIESLGPSSVGTTTTTTDNGYYSYYRYYSTPNVGNDRAGLYVDHTDPVRSRWMQVVPSNNLRQNGMLFEIAPIYVIEGTLLRQMYSTLSNNVRITSLANGAAMAGRVVWIQDENTRVFQPGYYRFMFIPNNANYPATSAAVYIGLETERGPYFLQTNINNIVHYSDPYNVSKLWEMQEALNKAVSVNIRGTQRTVSGVLEWVHPNTSVYYSGSQQFVFTPDDRAYAPVKGWVYIDVRK